MLTLKFLGLALSVQTRQLMCDWQDGRLFYYGLSPGWFSPPPPIRLHLHLFPRKCQLILMKIRPTAVGWFVGWLSMVPGSVTVCVYIQRMKRYGLKSIDSSSPSIFLKCNNLWSMQGGRSPLDLLHHHLDQQSIHQRWRRCRWQDVYFEWLGGICQICSLVFVRPIDRR